MNRRVQSQPLRLFVAAVCWLLQPSGPAQPIGKKGSRAKFLNEEVHMPKFLIQTSFTKHGVKGLVQDGGSKRRQAVEQFFASVGGKLEAFYFAFGETDVFAIVDFPDNVSAAAISLTANARAAVDIKITTLITPEEMDRVTQTSQNLRPPVS